MFTRISSPFRIKSKQRKVVFEKRAPDNIEYIIVLPHKLFKEGGILAQIKLCLTRKYLAKLQENIVGKLHVVSQNAVGHPICDCCNKQFQVCDFIKQNSLLVKLPKEDMFVPIEEWDTRYLKSKVSELIDLMMYLGASEVQYNVINKNTSHDSQGIDADVSVYGINVGAGMELETGESSTHSISGRIIFQRPNVDIQKITDTKNFHYLSQNHDWQHMINQRIDACISRYEIKTHVSERLQINKSAKMSLQKLNINLHSDHVSTSNLMINMSARFIEFDRQSMMSPKSSGESIELTF